MPTVPTFWLPPDWQNIPESLIQTTSDRTLRLRTAENLIVLDPDNSVAITALALTQKKTDQKQTEQTRHGHKTKSTQTPDLAQDLHRFIAALEQKLSIAA